MSRLGSRMLRRVLFNKAVSPSKICCGVRYESGSPGSQSEQSQHSRKTENPISKSIRIISNDIKNYLNIRDSNDPNEGNEFGVIPSHCDILIIGGGIMGSSAAYWLKERARHGLNVIVVEKDPMVMSSEATVVNYTTASTVLSAGGIRQQFSIPENIQMSLFGADFLRNIREHLSVEGEPPPDAMFTPTGYLFLATEKGAQQMEENHKLQLELGAKNELLNPMQLKEKFPWINTDGIVMGCHGLRNEGWFDPWLLLDAFKKKAINLGVEYLKGEAIGFEFKKMEDMMVEGVEEGTYEIADKLIVKLPSGESHTIKFAMCILAAGAHSGKIAKMARIGDGPSYLRHPLPVEPRKRYVYCFNCRDGPGINTPLVIDPTGAYFRREGLGNNYIGGRSPDPDQEPNPENLDVDHQYFDDHVWPHLANRVKAFESVKVNSAWAGYYEYNTFDANGILGPHPYYHNLYIATGFSGHGIQHGPAVGRALMEMIIDGGFSTIDLSRLSFDRIIQNKQLLEDNIW